VDPGTRQKYSRNAARYQSTITGKEWQAIEPLLWGLHRMVARGRPRGWPLRESADAIFHGMRSGRPWRLIPAGLPP